MKKLNCPSCGAEAIFRSNLSVYAVCPHCRTTLVRHDIDVEAIGTMAALPDDMSPFQIGTEGTYKRIRFGIIGRVKFAYEAGSWNEWFLYTDDARKGWLAEAQGFYAVSFEVENSVAENIEDMLYDRYKNFVQEQKSEQLNEVLDQLIIRKRGERKKKSEERIAPGRYINIGKQPYKVVDIKRTTCAGSEGELPFSAPQGRDAISIDLLGPQDSFGCIEVTEEKIRSFTGTYVEWNDLKCSNFRTPEGW